jgi:putative peptidoglycan lipid II flippase
MVAPRHPAEPVVGLVRTRIFGHYLGTGDAADAFATAFRIPKHPAEPAGRGRLSASFIPVYAGLINRGDPESARKVARAIGALIALMTACAVALGVFAAPWLTDLVAGGFEGEKRALTIRLVRILFPGAALLVLSAWCLGILNSHRRFFLSYAAPVSWNVAMIAALLGRGSTSSPEALVLLRGMGLGGWQPAAGARAAAHGAQGAWRISGFHARRLAACGIVVANFGPAVLSRGVVQISAYVDTLIAFLPAHGGQSSLGYALTLYNLPVSLFGMSCVGCRAAGDGGRRGHRGRTLRVPARAAAPGAATDRLLRGAHDVDFVFLGHVVVGALYQSGRFTATDTDYVWAILAGCFRRPARHDARPTLLLHVLRPAGHAHSVGLRARTRRDERGAGWFLALHAPRLLGLEARWGAAGLTIAFSIHGLARVHAAAPGAGAAYRPAGAEQGYLSRLWAGHGDIGRGRVGAPARAGRSASE